MSYIDKIINHRKLELCDIIEFVNEYKIKLGLDSYIDTINIKNIFGGIAAYDLNNKVLLLDQQFFKRGWVIRDLKYCLGLNTLKILSSGNNDLFNLFVINSIFHEMWHAKQKKMIHDNVNSTYSQLINGSLELMRTSGSTYRYYHNKYFHEFDAMINSIKLSLDFFKKYNINENAISLINRFFADDILECYSRIETLHDEENDKDYTSPLISSKALDTGKLVPNWSNIIDSYISDNITDDDLINLLYGIQISDDFIEKLTDIRNGTDKTTDIFEYLRAQKGLNKEGKNMHLL